MSSGFGVHGGIGRCYPFYEDLEKCLKKADLPFQCQLFADDYHECVTRKKEMNRVLTIEKVAAQKGSSPASAPTHAAH